MAVTMNQGICMQSEIQRCRAVGVCSLVGYSSVHVHVPGVYRKKVWDSSGSCGFLSFTVPQKGNIACYPLS